MEQASLGESLGPQGSLIWRILRRCALGQVSFGESVGEFPKGSLLKRICRGETIPSAISLSGSLGEMHPGARESLG